MYALWGQTPNRARFLFNSHAHPTPNLDLQPPLVLTFSSTHIESCHELPLGRQVLVARDGPGHSCQRRGRLVSSLLNLRRFASVLTSTHVDVNRLAAAVIPCTYTRLGWRAVRTSEIHSGQAWHKVSLTSYFLSMLDVNTPPASLFHA